MLEKSGIYSVYRADEKETLEMFAMVCVAAILVGAGVLQFLAPDFIWSLTEWNNQLRGRQSERTELWEMGRVISGIILIITGIGFGLWGWSTNSSVIARETEATAVVQRRATEAASVAGQFDALLAPVMSTLLEQASEMPQRIRATELGLPTRQSTMLDYGRCESSGTFYVYIIGYEDGKDYAYTSGSRLCTHPYLSASSVRDLGESEMGGHWFLIAFLNDNSALATIIFRPVATALAAPTVTPTAKP